VGVVALFCVQNYGAENFSVENLSFVLTFPHRLKQVGFQQSCNQGRSPDLDSASKSITRICEHGTGNSEVV